MVVHQQHLRSASQAPAPAAVVIAEVTCLDELAALWQQVDLFTVEARRQMTRRAIELGCSRADWAQLVGCHVSTISRYLDEPLAPHLLRLPEVHAEPFVQTAQTDIGVFDATDDGGGSALAAAGHRLKQQPNDEIYTSAAVLAVARKLLGGSIDLDVASSAAANAAVQAQRYYTVADDGTQQPWAGTVWCNPPFSSKAAWIDLLLAYEGAWCAIFYSQLSAGSIRQLLATAPYCYLVPDGTAFITPDGAPASGLPYCQPLFATNCAGAVPAEWQPISAGSNSAAKQQAAKAAERERRAAAAQRRAAALAAAPDAPVVQVYHSAVADLRQQVPAGSVDLVFTDPPYEHSATPVYAQLAAFAAHALRPQGTLAVLCGAQYLDEVLAALQHPDLEWCWLDKYVLPGASTTAHQRKRRSQGKQVLCYTAGGGLPAHEWCCDVVTSPQPLRQQEADLHRWQQQEAGTVALLRRYLTPGGTVVDPFCGSGTTGAAAYACKAGTVLLADSDAECVAITQQRLGLQVAA